MQTFLPYPDFRDSARCLDRQRLGKQRVEVRQILKVLRGESAGWARHPAVLMWRGHDAALSNYGALVCEEWVMRGYRNNLLFMFDRDAVPPSWLGDDAFHASHRSNLLRKAPEHYGRFGWTEPDDLPYVWPCAKEKR